jgi:hypothetical protein
MAMTAVEKMRAMRARMRKTGLRPLQVWLLPDEFERVKAYVEKLVAKRKEKSK